MARRSGRSLSDEGSEVSTIVISGSPEMGLNDQPAPTNVTLVESREVFHALAAIQVIYSPEQSDKAKYTRAGCRMSLLPGWMLLNSYLPPSGPAPTMEEVLVPEPEGPWEIIDRWRPFNRGKS